MPGVRIPLLMIAIVLVGCDFPNCSEDAPEVAFARAMSQQRLSKLFEYNEQLLDADAYPTGFLDQPLPEPIADLPVKTIRSDGGKRVPELGVYYRLQGCMDHHVDLVVYDSRNDSPRIELWYGENPLEKEILWTR